jgi:D-alanyl-D-alanine carboxypeptidase
MSHNTCGVSRGFNSPSLRKSLIGGVAVLAVLSIAAVPADARRHGVRHAAASAHHVSHHGVRESGYSPPFASIVVDANTGKTLDEKSADGLRHPASLTKIMTLYLLFERLESGKMKLSNMMPVSEHASEQAPTKLGLRPGSSLNVEDAIRGLVTRSANDAAVVIAEAIGGDEEGFAKMMTAKARALGMSHTTYVNASGLPDDDQVTTARDQSVLGRAIQERFPRYYTYFSTSSFTYRGEEIRNHNHLLGRVEGVDGIKTGYTRASGFNLVTSVHRNGRHIVAVVLGGGSAGARDARMRDLIEEHIAEAANKRTATMIAENETAPVAEPPMRSLRGPEHAARQAAAAAPAGGFGLASLGSQPVAAPSVPRHTPAETAKLKTPNTAQASSEPIRPIAVKTIKVKLAPVHTASLAPAVPMIQVSEETGSTDTATAPKVAAAQPAPVAVQPAPVAPAPAIVAEPPTPKPEPVRVAAAVPMAPVALAAQEPAPMPAPVQPAQAAAAQAAPVQAAPIQVAKADPPAAPARAHSGWIIQIGAYGSEDEAKQHLDAAQSKIKSLSRADRFTETVTKDDKTFYRARFAGFDKDKAEATCKQLRHSDFACLTMKN